MHPKQHNRRSFIGKVGMLGLGSVLPVANFLKGQSINPNDPIPETCTVFPSETRGPYPLFDATQLSAQTVLVRSNIKETQTGVPLTLTITVQNTSCTPLPNMQVYIWHCTKAGLYSGYNTSTNVGQAGTTYLRGIQTTNSNGQVTFQTIFPGWYMGRLTHIHCEVYDPSNTLVLTSQFAFPLDSVAGSATALVNAANGQSNNTITAYSGDNVFSDGYSQQLLNLSGSVAAGYTATSTLIANYTITPLKLVSFAAGVENKNPMLWWITSNEVNVNHFEIEQSTHPSKNFETIGTVRAKNLTTESNYSFSPPTPLPADITYFRLKMIDKDGKYYYSSVATLHLETIDKLSIVNTFVTKDLLIKHPATYENSYVKIANLQGQIVATGKLKQGVTYTSIDVSFLKNGHYVVVIENGIDRLATKFFKN